MMRRLLIGAAVTLTVAPAAREQAHHVVLRPPDVTGPVANTTPLRHPDHGYPYNATPVDLGKQGYVEEEFFLTGTANRYNTPSGERGSASTLIIPTRRVSSSAAQESLRSTGSMRQGVEERVHAEGVAGH
jgi:hypothetical protein